MTTGKFGTSIHGSLAIIDTETTGVPGDFRARVIELAAAQVDPRTGRTGATFSRLINPGLENIFRDPGSISGLNLTNLPQSDPKLAAAMFPELLRSFEIHRISPATLIREGVTPGQAVGEFQSWMKANKISSVGAYNIPFDRKMLARMGMGNLPWRSSLDVMSQAQNVLGTLGYGKYNVRRSSLSISAELAAQILLDPSIVEEHRALSDVMLETRVLNALFDPTNPVMREHRAYTQGNILQKAMIAPRVQMRKFRTVHLPRMQKAVSRAGKFITKHPSYGVAAAVAAIGLAGIVTAPFRVSADDADHIQILGMAHGGLSEMMRRQRTDFGSGYQGTTRQDTGEMNRSTIMALAMTAGGVDMLTRHSLLFPGWAKSIRNYPQLQAMRKASKHGYKIVMGDLIHGAAPPRDYMDKLIGGVEKVIYGVKPTEYTSELSGFKGVVYNRGGTIPEGLTDALVLNNTTARSIGSDKYLTYQYLKELQPETMIASRFFDPAGGTSVEGHIFAYEAGGLQNLIIKKSESHLSKDVYLDTAKISGKNWKRIAADPQQWIIQRKLDLASEYRVYTAGGKTVDMVSRWGPLKKVTGQIGAFLGLQHLGENVVPVMKPSIRRGLSSLAEEAASRLPYEVGAFDIGLTKTGEMKIIEAQKVFGLRNPFLSARLRRTITGKTPRAALGYMAMYGVATTALAYKLMSGNDDDHNTIEGMAHGGIAERLRKYFTDFGSGWRGIIKMPASIAKKLSKLGFDPARGRNIDMQDVAKLLKTTRPAEMELLKMNRSYFSVAERKTGVGKEIWNELKGSTSYKEYIEFARELGQAKKAGFKSVSLITPKLATRGTFTHERLHSVIQELGVREQLSNPGFLLGGFEAGLREQLIKKGYTSSNVNEEFLTHALQELRHPGSTGLNITSAETNAATQYLKNAFSAKDDAYNTIPGLQHGGMAQWLRKIFTDFGSGWRGLVALPKKFSALFPGWMGFSGTKKQIMGSFAESLDHMKGLSVGRRAEVISDIDKWITHSFKENPFEALAVINPAAIKQEAKRRGVSYSKALKGTIAHERFHQYVAENPELRDQLSSFGMFITEKEEAFLAKRGYTNRGRFAEELDAFKFTSGEYKWQTSKGAMFTELRATREAGFIHGKIKHDIIRKSVNKYSMSADTLEASRKMSIHGLMGGSMHNLPMNRSSK